MSSGERGSRLVSYLLVAGMMGCLAAAVVTLGKQLAPDWHGDYLVLVAFLVSLEALASRDQVETMRFPSREWLTYRLTEWVVLLGALKGLLYLLHGIDQLWLDLPRWRDDFFVAFFTGEYLIAVLVAVVVWNIADWFAVDLLDLEASQSRLEFERATAIPRDRPAAQRAIAGRMFKVGATMIVLAGLARLDYRQFGAPALGPAGSPLPIVIYFLLGLLLLSQGQLSILRSSWSWQRIDVAPGVLSKWLSATVVFLAGATALAALLPTSYSLGLLTTLGYVIELLLALAMVVVLVVQAIVFLPIFVLLRLLGQNTPARPVPPIRLPPPPAAQHGGGPDWFEVLRSIVFWTLLLAVAGYSIYHYLKQREDAASTLARLPVLSSLAAIWRRLGLWLRGRSRRAPRRPRAASVPAELPALRPAGSAWRFFRPGGLSPREAILYFYLATLRRAEQSGLPRRPGQTPDEYRASLTRALPEARPDIEPLTRAFVEARYSRHLIVRGQADAVRGYWERLKSLLVRRRRGTGS